MKPSISIHVLPPPITQQCNPVHQIPTGNQDMPSLKQHWGTGEPAQLCSPKRTWTWLTFRNPSNTSFIFSYLLKRSASDFSTEFRSAKACSFSTISCWTVWWETDFSLCSSSVRKKRGWGEKAIFRRVIVVRTLISLSSIASTTLCSMLCISKFAGSRKVNIKAQSCFGKRLPNTVIFEYIDVGEKCEYISVLMIYTLVVPMKKAGVGFLVFAWRCTSWRKGYLYILLALALNYLALLIYACHLLASFLILYKQGTLFNGIQLKFFSGKTSILQTLILRITVASARMEI